MKREMMIKLPARPGIPAAELYCQCFSESEGFRKRNVMLMIPGGPGNDHAIYDPPDHSIAKALFPYVDIILFDPRSCGKSERMETHYSSLDHYIDDIEAIRKHFAIQAERFIIFGQSYGSIASLGYAARYPKSLKRLILIGGAASHEFLDEAKANLNKRGTPKQKELGEKIWTGSFTGEADENDEFFQAMTPLYQLSFKPGMPTPPLAYNVSVLNHGFGDFLKKFDFRNELERVECQTLILWGADDWIFDTKQAKVIHEGIKGSVLKIYSDCSHLLWLDQWEKFLRDVTQFLTH